VTSGVDPPNVDEATPQFLSDIRDGVEDLVGKFFPQLREPILQTLTGLPTGNLAISGMLTNDRNWISAWLFAESDASPCHSNDSGEERHRITVSWWQRSKAA
jgi:hypothetical protein